jgi:hypothetical protein
MNPAELPMGEIRNYMSLQLFSLMGLAYDYQKKDLIKA